MTDADATPGRQPPDPEDLLITCHARGQLRPLMDFREEDLDGGEPWCAGCREIAEELARDEEARLGPSPEEAEVARRRSEEWAAPQRASRAPPSLPGRQVTRPKRPRARKGTLHWFHADLGRRLDAFEDRLAEIGRDTGLLVEVRAALAGVPVRCRPERLSATLRRSRGGREAVTAIRRILTARSLPHELMAWIAWVVLSGESLPVLAADYREERIGPHANPTVELVTGDAYLTIRVPADWSGNTIVAALPYLRNPSIFPGVPPAEDVIGGRPRAIDPAEAVDLAHRFDERLARSGEEGKHIVKTWLARWEQWLTAELGPGPRPKARWLWRTAIRPAIERGEFAPKALEARSVGRLRRPS